MKFVQDFLYQQYCDTRGTLNLYPPWTHIFTAASCRIVSLEQCICRRIIWEPRQVKKIQLVILRTATKNQQSITTELLNNRFWGPVMTSSTKNYLKIIGNIQCYRCVDICSTYMSAPEKPGYTLVHHTRIPGHWRRCVRRVPIIFTRFVALVESQQAWCDATDVTSSKPWPRKVLW